MLSRVAVELEQVLRNENIFIAVVLNGMVLTPFYGIFDPVLPNICDICECPVIVHQ